MKRNRKTVCLVSPDISGFVINGGVGTSTIEMARLLIQLGYQVHVLYANRQTPNDSSFVWWQAKYLQEGIVLKPLKNPPYRIEHGHEYVRISYAVYHQLKSSKYHRIIFTEMLGGGYFCLRAKESGIEFKNTELWVIFHGPSLWHMRNNQALPMQLQQLSTNYMETQSIQLADRVLFATEHSKDQALKHLGITPKKYSVALYPFSAKKTSRTYRTCNELIFFGRIESRKGIEDFLDALVLLKSYITRMRVTPVLLGYIGLIKGVDGRKFLEKWQEENEITLQIVEGKNHYDAWEEIKKRRGLVVLASREETMGYTFIECLINRVPFIYADIPAFNELSQQLAFGAKPSFATKSPSSLAKAIKKSLDRPPRVRIQDFSNKLLLQWEKIFSQDISIIKARSINHTGGFSVCIPHHNRLDHLKFAVRSVLMQGADVREILIYNDPLEDKSKSGKIRQKLERMKMNWRHKVPLHIIYGESNKGPSNARNRMAEQASGEFLFFLDDDNQLKPNALRDLRRVLSNKSCDIVLSSLNRIGPSGMADGPASSVWPPVGEDISMNLFYNLIGDANFCIRKDAFHALGGFNEEMRGREDQEFLLKASIKGFQFAYVPKPLVGYYLHENNLHYTINTEENRYQFFRSIEKYLTNGLTPLWEMVQGWVYSQPPSSTYEWSYAPIGTGLSDWDSWKSIGKWEVSNFKKRFKNDFYSFEKGLLVKLPSISKAKRRASKNHANSFVKLILWLPTASVIATQHGEISLKSGRNEIIIAFKQGQKIELLSVSGAIEALVQDVC